MTDPIATPTCHDCGAPLPADSPQALCPACLMRQALASRTRVAGDEPASSPPPTPEEIADKFPQYEIAACLGRGGMGVVYKARQKSLDRWVAIKILRPERIGEEKFAERFAREAQTLARLNHPNIVTVFDYGETGGLFYIVMEFVDGVNLRDLLRDGKLDPQQALAIVPPICDALQYAHAKDIVHRDIKPENLLLDREGRVKIADFGIAKLIDPVAAVCHAVAAVDARRTAQEESQRRSQTAATINAGTQGYSAPEQESDPQHVDSRADIYSLGVVLYEMLTGERPGKELIAPSQKVQIDVRLDEIVLRALEKTPALRYQTAGILKTQIQTIVSEMGSAAVPVAPVDVPSAGTPGTATGGTPSAARGTRALPDTEPHFSRTAVVGACWAAAFLLFFLVKSYGHLEARHYAWWQELLVFTLPLTGLTAPFGTTILGWIAVSQIRRSAGKLCGLELAVFDGLLFPLLALDTLVFSVFAAVIYSKRKLPYSVSMEVVGPLIAIGLGLLTFALIVWLDIFIARRVWRAVNNPVAGSPILPAAPATRWQDWFWWFISRIPQPPRMREIYAHMTPSEKRSYTRLFTLVSLGLLVGCAMFGYCFNHPNPGQWILGAILFVAMVFGLSGVPKMKAEFLCSTAWARQQGITRDQLRWLASAHAPQVPIVGQTRAADFPATENSALPVTPPAKTSTARKGVIMVVGMAVGMVVTLIWIGVVAWQMLQAPPATPVVVPNPFTGATTKQPAFRPAPDTQPVKPTVTTPPCADQVIVEDLALRMLVAIREKDDATLRSLSTNQLKEWDQALPRFALEMRERFQQHVGKPFEMYPTESFVKGDRAVVKCTGAKEVYLVLYFVRTPDGWRNWMLRNSPLTVPLAKYWDETWEQNAKQGVQ